MKRIFLVLGLPLVAIFFVGLMLGAGNTVSGEDCVTKTVTDYGDTFVSHSWGGGDPQSACMQLSFETNGTFRITGGWVFTSPLTLNGQVITTTIVEGEAAPQISTFEREVAAGDVWEFRPSWNEPGTEMGIWAVMAEITAPMETIFLPMIIKPEPVTTVYHNGGLQVFQRNWSTAQIGDIICLNLQFDGGGDANIESGWFFGKWSEITLNGNPISVTTTPPSGGNAGQIGQKNLSDPNFLKACVEKVDASWPEIGIRIRFPG